AGAIAARASSTTTSGTPRPSERSQTSATAPRATASAAKSCPSDLNPRTQKNRSPGSTDCDEYASPETSTSGAPSPMSSRRVTARAESNPASTRRDAQVRQRERGDALERRRRDDAAVDLALRLVDHHGHQQARVPSGREPD